MNRRLVAFEGSKTESNVPVNWGAAAVEEGDDLVNPTTGHRTSLARLNTLVSEGHLVQLEKPITIKQNADALPLVVLELDSTHPLHFYVRVDAGKVNGVVAKAEHGEKRIYGFWSRELFDD